MSIPGTEDPAVTGVRPPATPPEQLACIEALHRKVQWLSAWMIHHANHIRPGGDELKVGGHQASSASFATVMTALYFGVLRPNDRIAVKPHASPVFHAIQYLLGKQTVEQLQQFRAFGGAQAYPSRSKDADDVDFSTGSVGLGVAVTMFAAMAQDFLHAKGWVKGRELGRMIALLGDAELDEGNVHEALIEGCKHNIRNTWWIVDYNRQSLDAVATDNMFNRYEDIFRAAGWQVITLKYGKQQLAAFDKPGGQSLRQWIDDCPNTLYSALTFKGGAAWRQQLLNDIGELSGVTGLLSEYNDDALQSLMLNLGGHDLDLLLQTFRQVDDDRPRCFFAYTIKGWGLPFQGHKDNHAGLMNDAQIEQLRDEMGITAGEEWGRFSGLDEQCEALQNFLAKVPFAQSDNRCFSSAPIEVPPLEAFSIRSGDAMSTQAAFGRIMNALGRGKSMLAARLITSSPDVTVSTNLGGWVNQRGIFNREGQQGLSEQQDVRSMQKWVQSPAGQHFELGIAENNLFLLLAALGLTAPLFGERLFPVGALYDPFICRGLDAMNYACYQDARFMLVATPSGITLAPEGGAHQSISTPLIGMAQDKLLYFEPAFVDELAEIMHWGFEYMQQVGGGSVYLRLSSRPLAQPQRTDERWRRDVLKGAYWQRPPEPGARLAIAYTGAVAPEAEAAFERLAEINPGMGLLAVPSPDRVYNGWIATEANAKIGDGRVVAHISRLLKNLAPDARLVTVLDGAPATLSWLGAVAGHRVRSLGVTHFGQSGEINDLYREHGLDTEAICTAGEQLMG